MFGLKKKNNKQNKQNQLLTAYDRLETVFVSEKSNEQLFKMCDSILSGKPVLANFEKLSAAECNYMLSFISGVVYATDGETIQVGAKSFLFARKEEYEDGTLKQYVEDIR